MVIQKIFCNPISLGWLFFFTSKWKFSCSQQQGNDFLIVELIHILGLLKYPKSIKWIYVRIKCIFGFIQDVFWWFFLDKYEPNGVIQKKIIERIADNYVKFLWMPPTSPKTMRYRNDFFKVIFLGFNWQKKTFLACGKSSETLEIMFEKRRTCLPKLAKGSFVFDYYDPLIWMSYAYIIVFPQKFCDMKNAF